MIKVFYGDDRLSIDREVKDFLGNDYEVVEGSELEPNDLPSLFLGSSLFDSKRKILIRDLVVNKPVAEQVSNYLSSSHDVVLLELKIAKNSQFYKSLSDKVTFREFKLPETNSYRQAMNIYNTAKQDGKKAVRMLEKVKNSEDPIGFAGMIISIAIKDFESHQGIKEKRVLKELSKLDIDIKTTTFSPWTLLSAFLLRLSSL